MDSNPQLSVQELLAILRGGSGVPTIPWPRDYRRVEELMVVLVERGLSLPDPEIVKHHLTAVGHYRLSAYYRAFYKPGPPDKQFDETVPIDGKHLTDLYAFDRRLRLLLLGPLEKVEVALRSLIVKEIGDFMRTQNAAAPVVIDLFDQNMYDLTSEKNRGCYESAQGACKRGAWEHWAGRFALTQEGNAFERIQASADASNSQRRLAKLERQRIFNQYYSSLPAWQILQTASFGPLANIFSALRREIATEIARHFNLPRPVLTTAFFALKELRNSCAHHEPVWNWNSRYHRTSLAFPKSYRKVAQIGDENRYGIYAYCAMIHILLGFLSHGHSTWYMRLKELVREFSPMCGAAMGFPQNWQTLPFWSVSEVKRTAPTP